LAATFGFKGKTCTVTPQAKEFAMKPAISWIAIGCLSAALLPALAAAQTPDKHMPAKAKLPAKPPVVTAVAPRIPTSPGQNSIIFVGGHIQTGDAALNPQPIPPGQPIIRELRW
jgi:hypothetical protein